MRIILKAVLPICSSCCGVSCVYHSNTTGIKADTTKNMNAIQPLFAVACNHFWSSLQYNSNVGQQCARWNCVIIGGNSANERNTAWKDVWAYVYRCRMVLSFYIQLRKFQSSRFAHTYQLEYSCQVDTYQVMPFKSQMTGLRIKFHRIWILCLGRCLCKNFDFEQARHLIKPSENAMVMEDMNFVTIASFDSENRELIVWSLGGCS